MKVLVTGHDGYIGTVLTPLLAAAGHEVVGLDTGLFAACSFGEVPQVESMAMDVRDVRAEHLTGFDAVLHLAAISNDPIGDLNPEVTYLINHQASVALAREAKQAGVQRYVFSSSCSTYGAAEDDDALDEVAASVVQPLLAHAPLTMWAAKQAVSRLRRANLPDGDDFVARAFGSDDFHRAVQSFSAKQRPVWQGR